MSLTISLSRTVRTPMMSMKITIIEVVTNCSTSEMNERVDTESVIKWVEIWDRRFDGSQTEDVESVAVKTSNGVVLTNYKYIVCEDSRAESSYMTEHIRSSPTSECRLKCAFVQFLCSYEVNGRSWSLSQRISRSKNSIILIILHQSLFL